MNYRHSFHAGNFADCLKHLVLVAILQFMQKKESGISIIDCFAGIGVYDLHDDKAGRSPEYLDGIVKIWDYAQNQNVETAISEFINAQKAATESQRYYAGSPFLLAKMLRENDNAIFNELHGEQFRILGKNIHEFRRRCACKKLNASNIDGYLALKAKLPPTLKRGLIIIDPPFEKPNEFKRIIDGVIEGQKRFSNGVFAIWYADKNVTDTAKFIKGLQAVSPKLLDIRMQVQNPNNISGLASSGMAIINPPFGLEDYLKPAIAQLCDILKKGEGEKYSITFHESI